VDFDYLGRGHGLYGLDRDSVDAIRSCVQKTSHLIVHDKLLCGIYFDGDVVGQELTDLLSLSEEIGLTAYLGVGMDGAVRTVDHLQRERIRRIVALAPDSLACVERGEQGVAVYCGQQISCSLRNAYGGRTAAEQEVKADIDEGIWRECDLWRLLSLAVVRGGVVIGRTAMRDPIAQRLVESREISLHSRRSELSSLTVQY
jgi:hypothetical protein